MSLESTVANINWGASLNTVMLWIMVFVVVFIVGLLAWWLYMITTFNIQVELIRQVGQPYYAENEDGTKTLKINYKSENKPAKMYQKKLKSGGFKEYFKIKGTNWNYLNYFKDIDFFMRKPNTILDFKKRGIKVFVDQERGLVPLRLANPGFDYSEVTLNEVIGAVTDSLHEREQLYGNDFWAKYGALITIGSLMAFFIIGMIFLIKYQDTFWKNSLGALQSTFNTMKDISRQNLV